MHCQKDDSVMLAESDQSRSQEWTITEAEAADLIFLRESKHFGFAYVRGQGGKIHHLGGRRNLRTDMLGRFSRTQLKCGPQRLVPPDNLIEALICRVDVEPACETNWSWHIERRIAGLQLIEKPQPLLRE
jgi:hypothetical protein